MDVCWTTPQANRGYSAPGREKVSQLADISEVEKVRSQAPDLKETFEIGREGEPGHPNQWPVEDKGSQVEGFKADMLGFFDQLKALHVDVMKAIAIGMGLDEGFFNGFVDVGDNTLRLLHYPEVDSNVFKINPGQVRAGEHSVSTTALALFTYPALTYVGLRFNHIAIPGQPRRPTGQESERPVRRRHAHRGHSRCQCRRLASEMVQRHDQEHSPQGSRATTEGWSSLPTPLQHRVSAHSVHHGFAKLTVTAAISATPTSRARLRRCRALMHLRRIRSTRASTAGTTS